MLADAIRPWLNVARTIFVALLPLSVAVHSASSGLDILHEFLPLPDVNWTCNGGSKRLLVIWPAGATEQLPLISFAHGMGVGPDFYFQMLAALARQGFVVVAPTAGQTGMLRCDTVMCETEWQDQQTAIEVAHARRNEAPFDAVDWKAPVTIAGHSMGGVSTLMLSQQLMLATKPKPWSVGAAVDFAPGGTTEWILNATRDAHIPTLSVAGALDLVNGELAAMGLQPFRGAKDAIVVTLEGADHDFGAQSPGLVSDVTAPFLRCHVLKQSADCEFIYEKWRAVLRQHQLQDQPVPMVQPPPISMWCPSCKVPPPDVQPEDACLMRTPELCREWTALRLVEDKFSNHAECVDKTSGLKPVSFG